MSVRYEDYSTRINGGLITGAGASAVNAGLGEWLKLTTSEQILKPLKFFFKQGLVVAQLLLLLLLSNYSLIQQGITGYLIRLL
jgi:hypothetical protein